MSDEVIALLKVHEYFQGASDETLQEVARLGRVAQYPAGSVVHEADVVLTTVGFVLRGRLKAVRVNANGTESLFRMIERGEQFGMMVGALGESVPIRVVALEPTTVLRLDYEEALELSLARPDLRRLWLKTYAGILRKLFFGAAPKRSAMMLALVHDSPATRPAAERLIHRLGDVGEQLAVFSDSDRRWDSPNVRFRPLRDAVHAILESINLPVLSAPIVRNGQALIDGGLVNNIPADVLVSTGCNFVIAASVSAKLESRFCDISPEKPSPFTTRSGIMPTIVHSLLVQNYNLNAFGVQPADVVIEPDVTAIDPSEFMRAKELAAIGEAAALKQIPKLHRLLNRLDPQLFKSTSDTNGSALA